MGKAENTDWELVEQQAFHYDFAGDLVIKRDVFEHIALEDVCKIMTNVYKQVKEKEGLDTKTLYFKKGDLKIVVQDSHAREEISGNDLSRSGEWHRKNKYNVSVTVEKWNQGLWVMTQRLLFLLCDEGIKRKSQIQKSVLTH